jgi:phospholipid-binding lipoprotein MlaA
MKVFLRNSRCLLVAAVAMFVTGCATTSPEDPFEGYNRAMFKVNEKLDKVVLKPTAKAYAKVMPGPVRTGVSNAFGNVGEPWVGLNNLLQGKPADALSDVMRFLVNSTFGIAGLLDVASEAGLPRHDEDLGQTLGVWGVGDGPYIVLPFFGSHTLRDTVVLPLDATLDDAWVLTTHLPSRNVLSFLQIVNERAAALGLERTLEEGTLDKYRFVRDFYLQQRRYKVHDGDLPAEDDDFYDGGDSLVPSVSSESSPENGSGVK